MIACYRLAIMSLGLLLCFFVVFQGDPVIARDEIPKNPPLPLGPPDLKETRETTPIAPGVTYTKIVRGETSKKDYYRVDVAFVSALAEAEKIARQLEADGYEPRIQRIGERAQDDPEPGPLGYVVHVGRFSERQLAEEMKAELSEKGYAHLRTVYTGENGDFTTGPWQIHVLEIDPKRFKGRISPQLANGIIPGREPLTMMSLRTEALAGINGGYFVIGDQNGTDGDLAGISVIDGKLLSEAVNGRTGLIIPSSSGKGTKIATLSTKMIVYSSDGGSRELDGLNRKPGLIRSCGGTGGDLPTSLPKHDFTCTDESELIQFTSAFGKYTEPGTGAEAVLDEKGKVIEFREARGGAIPDKGSVLSATGDAVDWLRTHAKPGKKMKVDASVYADGHPLIIKKPLGIMNGGPRLLHRGKTQITAFAEGFHWPENPEFYYRFGFGRHPRTLAGITSEGHILLVAVDGRRPGISVGASFEESAGIMKSLGASEAVNLDGGGSTTMTVHQQLVNQPSDAAGERPIGDALLIFSEKK